MLWLLAVRNIAYRPWRSLLLFLGYGIGVGVMIVLLAVGEALLTQARDERLVGGGSITVLPEGVDIEVLKTGGLGGLLASIDHSRFIDRQILSSPRLAGPTGPIRAVAPQIDGKLVYLRHAGRDIAVRAFGELPDATRAVGAAPALAAGRWVNDDGDRRYAAPTRAELDHELDHFHLPPQDVANADSWAEWHYFNVLSPDHTHWVFLSFIVAGDVRGAPSGWGGRVAITVVDRRGGVRRYASTVPSSAVRFSTTDANVSLGPSRVTVLPDGRYAVTASAVAEGPPPRGTITANLIVSPAPRAYFPGTSLAGGDIVSGYVVPALRADATGTVCENGQCESYTGVQAYHDHNWGVWRGVTWDWGAARAGAYTLLYGRVVTPDRTASPPPLFVYLVDSLGFLAAFRPPRIAYTDGRAITVGGTPVRVPIRALFADLRGTDSLWVQLDVQHALGTDNRRPLVERGDLSAARALLHPYFIQMYGTATLAGRVNGSPVAGQGDGFFETYR